MKIDKSKKRYTILIVDDIPKNVELAANILQAENYNITFTTSGEAALKKVNEIDFDLILLDVMMPGMDGFEVCRILKSDPKFKEIPIIFLTAKSETENIVLGFELGAVDYVTKPFSAEELLARVKNHLSIREKILEKDNLEKQLSDDTSTMDNSTRQQLETQLNEKKEELNQINLFYDLRSQMDKLLQDKTPIARMEIKHIKEMISNLFIDKSSQEFHKALKAEFPKLTFDDLRLCSYLKHRFLNVEIAEFLETSPEAVYTRKSRLRQKLNLEKNQDINDFLSNYTY
ncbi:MAG: response regulator [Bacteroidales bacterium]|jgi:DNA-binding response OmpR family regulator|nr:response regulator [Bacteroidales bacterium]MDI9592633.1 response regulator [Bacteroidota bacterium]NLH33807.1 response regulator [Lentimicrobium sp.]OQC37068.1 MAG: DNA-binding response regulator MtrA [Bacteroidetes bacterium ADurb.Bin041]MBP7873855.1 response regulator [Bacteroidales bacterium]